MRKIRRGKKGITCSMQSTVLQQSLSELQNQKPYHRLGERSVKAKIHQRWECGTKQQRNTELRQERMFILTIFQLEQKNSSIKKETKLCKKRLAFNNSAASGFPAIKNILCRSAEFLLTALEGHFQKLVFYLECESCFCQTYRISHYSHRTLLCGCAFPAFKFY